MRVPFSLQQYLEVTRVWPLTTTTSVAQYIFARAEKEYFMLDSRRFLHPASEGSGMQITSHIVWRGGLCVG